MFRDDQQAPGVCKILVSNVGLGSLWTEDGPTKRAGELMKANGGPLSSGERVMLLFAFTVWNSSNDRLTVSDLFRLDEERLDLVGSLLSALAVGESETIDDWIVKQKMVLETRERQRAPQSEI